jgi:hypothetical protein
VTSSLLRDDDGTPVVYRALGAYFALEPLAEEDVERIEQVNALILA